MRTQVFSPLTRQDIIMPLAALPCLCALPDHICNLSRVKVANGGDISSCDGGFAVSCTN